MLRWPAIHFLVIGAGLYALQGLAGSTEPVRAADGARPAIVVKAADLARMRRSYELTKGAEPDEAAYRQMIATFVENEALYREAIVLGLDRADQTVRWRLIEKMQVLGEAGETDPADEVVQRALALGLQRDDPIVRNVLIDKYRMLVRYAHGGGGLTQEQLRAYYERNKERFLNPPRVSFSHVFFSAQRRGEGARADAQEALSRLRSTAMTDEQAIALGDVFLGGHAATNQNAQGLGRLFGAGFASVALAADEGAWTGPFESAFGQHLVFVSSHGGGGTLPFEAVRSRVAKAAANELSETRLQTKIAELRDRYDVVIRAEGFFVDGDA